MAAAVLASAAPGQQDVTPSAPCLAQFEFGVQRTLFGGVDEVDPAGEDGAIHHLVAERLIGRVEVGRAPSLSTGRVDGSAAQEHNSRREHIVALNCISRA